MQAGLCERAGSAEAPSPATTSRLVQAFEHLRGQSSGDPDVYYGLIAALQEHVVDAGLPAPSIESPRPALSYYMGDRLELFGQLIAKSLSAGGTYDWIETNPQVIAQLEEQLIQFSKKQLASFGESCADAADKTVHELIERKVDTVIVLGASGFATALALQMACERRGGPGKLSIHAVAPTLNEALYDKANSSGLSLVDRRGLWINFLRENGIDPARTAIVDDHASSGTKLRALDTLLKGQEQKVPVFLLAGNERFQGCEADYIARTDEAAKALLQHYMQFFSRCLRQQDSGGNITFSATTYNACVESGTADFRLLLETIGARAPQAI